MDRALLHDIRTDLAVAIGSVHAFIDGKLAPTAGNLTAVLDALESFDGRVTQLHALPTGLPTGRERLLQAMVEGSPYAKVLIDGRGRITLVNAQAERLFGYTREELIGCGIETLVPERFRRGHPNLRGSFAAEAVARPMGAGRDLYGRRKDGSEVPIEIGLNPIETDGGLFTLAAITDITERKYAEEQRLLHAGIQRHADEIELLNSALAEASRFKSQFVATMSHELRTPLNAIVGAAELLALTEFDRRTQVYVETIEESAQTLLSLIRSILDFSKIEAGKLELLPTTFEVDGAIEGVAEVLAQLAGERGVTVHTDVDLAIPPIVGDVDRVRQILLNLVGNAVKFTESGQVVARVFPIEASASDVTLRFEVQDTGIGIAPEVLPQLFEPFVQADGSASRKYGGSGLGLSISKRLAELMGGEIGVRSELGVGSSFWFTARFERAGRAVTKNRALDGVAGLIVSTDDTFVRIVTRYMDSWGMRSHQAPNCSSGSEVVRGAERRVWIAIVDLDGIAGLENASGFDRLRERVAGRTIAVGSGASLRKPVRQSALFDAIVKAIYVESAVPVDAERTRAAGLANADGPVLVAEDNLRLQLLLKFQFEELDVPVAFVSDGLEAIEALRCGAYSMVFMDCQMPHMDGLTATRAIRAAEERSGGHVPIAAMTANAFAEDRAACIAAGMDDYLAKPVRLTNLRSMIERWSHWGPKAN